MKRMRIMDYWRGILAGSLLGIAMGIILKTRRRTNRGVVRIVRGMPRDRGTVVRSLRGMAGRMSEIIKRG